MIGKYYREFKISSLSKIIGAKYNEKVLKDAVINRVLTQSVYAKPGDAIIVARWYNPQRTIEEALSKGATVVFCEARYARGYSDKRIVVVDDPMDCVERVEKYCEQGCNAKRITITGSVGKTTTTGLINSIINKKFKTLTHHTMANSHGAILRNFQQLAPEHEYWVQEVGGVQPGYIESSAYTLHSDAVVLTNIGTSHLDKYLTKKGIFRDKSSLERFAKSNGIVVVNYDDPILKNSEYYHNVISFAMNDKNVDYYAENVEITREGTNFRLICKEGTYKVYLKLFGKHNVYNALAAIAIGRWAAVPMKEIIELIGQYEPDGMRQNMLNVGGYQIMVDCFNAEPTSVIGSAETLASIKMNGEGRKVFITGHIDKLGENSVKMHTDLGYSLAKLDIDVFVFFAGDSKYTYDSVVEAGHKCAYYIDEREELDDWIRNNITKQDVTFFKSGQFKAALAKTVDHVYGTKFQNEQQFNEGEVKKEGEFNFRLRQDDIVELDKYEGSTANLQLPERYNEFPILRICNRAFSKNTSIESVILPDSVENIGQEAFYSCPNLSEVKLPRNLKYICRSAFNNCRKLSKIVLPKGMLHIEYRAFRDCKALTEIVIPETVGFIGDEAFYECNKLKILCVKDSYAEQYAKDHHIKYEICVLD